MVSWKTTSSLNRFYLPETLILMQLQQIYVWSEKFLLPTDQIFFKHVSRNLANFYF